MANFQPISQCPSFPIRLASSIVRANGINYGVQSKRVPTVQRTGRSTGQRSFKSTVKNQKDNTIREEGAADSLLGSASGSIVGSVLWRNLRYTELPSMLKTSMGRGKLESCIDRQSNLYTSTSEVLSGPDNRVWEKLVYTDNHLVPTGKFGHSCGYKSRVTVWDDLNYIPSPRNSSKIIPTAPAEDPGPWYMRDGYAIKSSSVPERAPLPPLPELSPALLEEIITQLDADLGITCITIMDLRPLDPAPALGRNIIMVFGTANSDRHLHSSADQVCRWLRTTHCLEPYADGLVGRNARKLINRRRVRRGNVTATQIGVTDESLVTEWVCVNTGYEGIVLQLFTKKRRKELNLEGLWERKLDTSRKNREKLIQATEMGERVVLESLYANDEKPQIDVEVLEGDSLQENYPETLPTFSESLTISSFPNQQTRTVHTSSRPLPATTSYGLRNVHSVVRQKSPSTFQELINHIPLVSADIHNGSYGTIEQSFSTYYPTVYFPPFIKQAAILFAHVFHLQNTPPDVACEALGSFSFDTTSTPFLRSFFHEMPPVLAHIHYHAWLALLVQAHFLKPSTYPETCFRELIIQMKASSLQVPIPFYISILEILATTPSLRQKQDKSVYLETRETSRRMKAMHDVLEDMSRSSTYDINTPDIYTLLARGLMSEDIEAFQRLALDVCEIPGAAARNRGGIVGLQKGYWPDRRIFLIERLMEHYTIPQTNHEWYVNFLTATAIAGYWPAFWNRWKDVHYYNFSRGTKLYKLVLGLVALSGNRIEAVNTMRNLRASMDREQPKVVLDVELARGFLAVLDVAGGMVQGENIVGIEYAGLKRACEGLVQQHDAISRSIPYTGRMFV